ncbi:heme exporter protein CcmD [Aliidiomarina iranensis]|uniref:Heme exporter protein D n=1 Tax=Aliidiomarina iranensis TaxID=1434071 RepID=A0A432VQ80_9GAMM|nr:heme exporter protein CcmD [Aliidiomarina iranensis]RUO18312.1 heme exporter protein CcmD [Aliidiomarina iranensis]
MQFDSWQAFIQMGGYGIYVWSSFAGTFLCFGLLALESIWRRKKLAKEASKQAARAQRILRARAAKKNRI